MKERTRYISLIIIYLIIVLSCAVTVAVCMIAGPGEGQLGREMSGVGFLRAFTTDSNILSAIVSLLALVYIIINKKAKLSAVLHTLNLVGTCSVLLTLTVVVLFLSPKEAIGGGSYFEFLTGKMFHLHLLNPLLAAVAFVISSRGCRFSALQMLLSLVPVLIYSVFYTLSVFVFKSFEDFYGFTMGGSFLIGIIFALVLFGVTFLIAFILAKICRGRVK